MDDVGRARSETGSREPSPDGLGPSGFDPSRECTCHPDDRPEGPCQKRYAASECKIGAAALALEKARRGIRHHLGTGLIYRSTGKDPKNDGYSFAEVPDWQLRQWVEIIEAAASAIEARSDGTRSGPAEGKSAAPKADAQEGSNHAS